MANRNFNRKQALEKEVKEIYAYISIAGSGVPTLDAVNSKGVASISRTSAGLYVLTLQDSYVRLMHADLMVVTAAAENININLKVSDVVVAKTVTFLCTAAGSATDPASGDSVTVALQLKNSSVP